MKIQHIPLQPPRVSIPMEGIYASLWRNFAEQRPDEWKAIFRDCPTNPRQRAASVAASFMVFMGCNGGREFTAAADRLAATGARGGKEAAYLAAWALTNDRTCYINSGLRTIEYMLASEYPIHTTGIRHGHVNWQSVPTVTMDDIDVIECMVRWWSGTTAHVIREHAAVLLEAHNSDERMRHHMRHNTGAAS